MLPFDSRIYIAGHRGMVGSALVRRLRADGFANLITRTHRELDLTDQAAVRAFFQETPVDQVILAAARVGGIQANDTYPADFLYENLLIEANVIQGAFQAGVRRLLFLGSSCIYPRLAPQPIPEEALLTGPLEPTNEPYALAKIAGIKLCESYNRQYGTDYRSLMPTNLYGPGDRFDRNESHVIPALLGKFHEAKRGGRAQVEVWGTGTPRREFLHVDDLAAACSFVIQLSERQYWGAVQPRCSHLNVGVGKDLAIGELAALIARVVGYSGAIRYDTTKPDGTPRKLLDVRRLKRLGWQATIGLDAGLRTTYAWFLSQDGIDDGNTP